MSELHSVVFKDMPNNTWTTKEAKAWLKHYKLKPIKRVDIVKVDGVISQRRYRIKDPKLYKSFITKPVLSNGKHINLVIGFK